MNCPKVGLGSLSDEIFYSEILYSFSKSRTFASAPDFFPRLSAKPIIPAIYYNDIPGVGTILLY